MAERASASVGGSTAAIVSPASPLPAGSTAFSPKANAAEIIVETMSTGTAAASEIGSIAAWIDWLSAPANKDGSSPEPINTMKLAMP